jgi:hypothetical protein
MISSTIEMLAYVTANICIVSIGKTVKMALYVPTATNMDNTVFKECDAVALYVPTATNMDNTVFKECDAVKGGGSLPKCSGHLFSFSFFT